MQSPNSSKEFLAYFQRELNYLKQAGQAFAQKHPKTAGQLSFHAGAPQDPEVERLVESFAFLTAQLHQKVDEQSPKIARDLLHVLYPQFTQPLPSVGIAQFEYDTTRSSLSQPYTVARHTELFAYDVNQNVIRFQTAYPVTLHPLSVRAAHFVPGYKLSQYINTNLAPFYIKLILSIESQNLNNNPLKNLMFYLKGDRFTSACLYQALMKHPQSTLLYQCNDQGIKRLRNAYIRPMGFDRSEQLCPSPEYTHPAYQLLLEYFHAPEKHFFITLEGLDNVQLSENTKNIDIFLPVFDEKIPLDLIISQDNFALGCTPIVNIFEKTTDPFSLTHEKNEYKLIPDRRGEHAFEIHSILNVYGTGRDGQTYHYAPYHAFQHHHTRDRVWSHRREHAHHYVGSDVYLSLMDHNLNPNTTDYETIYAKVLCTNRDLAHTLKEGDELYHDGGIPTTRITCCVKPNMPSYTMMEGDMLWKMVSQLSIHHLGYNDPAVALSVLKETLLLHANMSHTYTGGQIHALTHFSTHEVVRRIPRYSNNQAWCGYLKGTGAHVHIDESQDPSGMSFILAHVLWHFLAMNVRVDSFLELTLTSEQREDTWCHLPPLNGYQNLM